MQKTNNKLFQILIIFMVFLIVLVLVVCNYTTFCYDEQYFYPQEFVYEGDILNEETNHDVNEPLCEQNSLLDDNEVNEEVSDLDFYNTNSLISNKELITNKIQDEVDCNTKLSYLENKILKKDNKDNDELSLHQTNLSFIKQNSTSNQDELPLHTKPFFCKQCSFINVQHENINECFSSQMTSAQSAVLIEAFSGRVLYEKNENAKLPVASTTKIVTAIVIIENCDLDKIITINNNSVGIEGSSVYLQAGEQLTIRDLLYCLMLRSGNDSAVALAYECSGSIEGFAKLMNKYSQSLGATNTNFVNPHGLHNDNHYTSAHDLALITANAMNNPEFEQISSCKEITICKGKENQRHLVNKNKLLNSYKNSNGVKTGYTKIAGRCFVGSAKQDNMQLVAVVINCGPMFEDCSVMLDYGFNRYTMRQIVLQNELCAEVKDNSKKLDAVLLCPEAFSYPITNGEKIEIKLNVPTSIDNASSQQEIGDIQVLLDNQLIYCKKLVNINWK